MDIFNIDSIIDKVEDKASWISWGLTAYERYPDLGRLFAHYTNFGQGGALNQAMMTIQNPKLLKWKLWDAPHAYTGVFKIALITWLAAELGIFVPKKYQNLAKKVMMGAGFSALTLGGSSPQSSYETAQNNGSYVRGL